MIFTLAYILMHRNIEPTIRLINAIFIIGLIYLIIGMGIYIRNVGLFKTFRYWAYKFKTGAYKKDRIGEVNVMSFAEFTEVITSEKNKISGKYYFLYGVPLVSASYLLSFII